MKKITIKIVSNKSDFSQIQVLLRNSGIIYDVTYHHNTSVTGKITGYLPDLFSLFYKCGSLRLLLLSQDI